MDSESVNMDCNVSDVSDDEFSSGQLPPKSPIDTESNGGGLADLEINFKSVLDFDQGGARSKNSTQTHQQLSTYGKIRKIVQTKASNVHAIETLGLSIQVAKEKHATSPAIRCNVSAFIGDKYKKEFQEKSKVWVKEAELLLMDKVHDFCKVKAQSEYQIMNESIQELVQSIDSTEQKQAAKKYFKTEATKHAEGLLKDKQKMVNGTYKPSTSSQKQRSKQPDKQSGRQKYRKLSHQQKKKSTQ